MGKTGIFIEVNDTISERTYYKGQFYSGKASFAEGEALTQTVKLLFPREVPNTEFAGKIALRNWINQEEYASFSFTMTVADPT